MKSAAWALRGFAAGAGLVALLAAQGCWAQAAVPAGQKVSGQQLQKWLNTGFSYAGVHKASECVLLNTGDAARRVLFLRCPNGWADKLIGTARVVGDNLCTNFAIPNTPPGEDCVSWHSVGQWKFEQRKGDALEAAVVVLPAGVTASP